MNDINTIYDAITKRRCCSNGGGSDDSGSGGGATVGGLVVHGSIVNDDSNNLLVFVPEKGEASFSDARDAYLSGIPVMYSITRQDQDADETEVGVFMSYYINREEEPAFEVFNGIYDGDAFVWLLASPNDDDEPKVA